MMALPLVVGVDGSDGSLLAIDWAVDEAQRQGLPLRLVYASLWERYEGALPAMGRERPSEQVMAENIVGTAAERVRRYDPGLTVDTDTVPAEAVSALLAEGRHATAVVTGSRGRGELKGRSSALSASPSPLGPTARWSLSGVRSRRCPAPTSVSCWVPATPTPAVRPCGSPFERPTYGVASWTSYGPGGARRTRTPTRGHRVTTRRISPSGGLPL